MTWVCFPFIAVDIRTSPMPYITNAKPPSGGLFILITAELHLLLGSSGSIMVTRPRELFFTSKSGKT